MLVEKRMKKGFFEPRERLDGGTSEKKGAVTCRLPAQLKDYALGLRSCLASAQTADNCCTIKYIFCSNCCKPKYNIPIIIR
jgi:hypothetical protein